MSFFNIIRYANFAKRMILKKLTLKYYLINTFVIFSNMTEEHEENKIFIKDDILSMLNMKALQPGLRISTMTVTGHIDTEMFFVNVFRYLDLSVDRIARVRYKNVVRDYTGTISIVKKNQNGKKRKINVQKKVRKNFFFNQVSFIILPKREERIDDIIIPLKKVKKKENRFCIKIFGNGSIQITGVKTTQDLYSILLMMFDELKKVKAIRNDKLQIEEKKFVTNYDFKLSNLTVELINVSFKIDKKIDRDILYESLKIDGINCKFTPNTHAGVRVKYNFNGKNISIFVFEKGSIIITGGTTIEHVNEARNFVIAKIDEYGEAVEALSFDILIQTPEIQRLIDRLNAK